MSLMAPKMDSTLGHIKDLTGFAVPLEKVVDADIALNLLAIFLRKSRRLLSEHVCYIFKRAFFAQEHYVLLLGAAIVLELVGGVLFILNSSIGAYFLVRERIAKCSMKGCPESHIGGAATCSCLLRSYT